MNDKIEAGRRIASQLFAAERAIDTALSAAASLQIALIEARQETRQPCGTIQESLDDAVTASASLMEARRAIVGAHDKLERMRDDFGVPATAVGCQPGLKPPRKTLEETAELKAV